MNFLIEPPKDNVTIEGFYHNVLCYIECVFQQFIVERISERLYSVGTLIKCGLNHLLI